MKFKLLRSCLLTAATLVGTALIIGLPEFQVSADSTIVLDGLTSNGDVTINSANQAINTYTLTSNAKDFSMVIPAGTSMLDSMGAVELGKPLTNISARPISMTAPPTIIVAYELGPNTDNFNPAITLTFNLAATPLPAGVQMTDLQIGQWDGYQWTILDSTIDPVAMTISTSANRLITLRRSG